MVADRYRDIALCARSLRRNLDTDAWTPALFKALGIGRGDRERIEYYQLVDKLL